MTEKKIFALGFFDGVHLGHQVLLQKCRALADTNHCSAGVVTFTAHPETLVLGQAPKLINSVQDRKGLLLSYGMDSVLALSFDETLRTTHWSAFLGQLEQLGAAGFVCGSDFRFGAGGSGTAKKLAAYCEKRQLPYAVVDQQLLDGVRVSSTHIRALLEAGDMAQAVRFLGHPHVLSGTVVPGKQVGRTIGVPTANLALPEGVLCPKHGVYACRISIGARQYLAVTNVGSRPTVQGSGITVEPFVLDFDGDLYGKNVTLAFYKYLRPEQKFGSLEELRTQIQVDAAQTQEFFKKT